MINASKIYGVQLDGSIDFDEWYNLLTVASSLTFESMENDSVSTIFQVVVF